MIACSVPQTDPRCPAPTLEVYVKMQTIVHSGLPRPLTQLDSYHPMDYVNVGKSSGPRFWTIASFCLPPKTRSTALHSQVPSKPSPRRAPTNRQARATHLGTSHSNTPLPRYTVSLFPGSASLALHLNFQGSRVQRIVGAFFR